MSDEKRSGIMPLRAACNPPKNDYAGRRPKASPKPKTCSENEVTFHPPPVIIRGEHSMPNVAAPSPRVAPTTLEKTDVVVVMSSDSAEEKASAMETVGGAMFDQSGKPVGTPNTPTHPSSEMVSVGVKAGEDDTYVTEPLGIEAVSSEGALPRRLAVEEMRDTHRMSGWQVDFRHQVNIPAPSERYAMTPQYELLKTVSADEADALLKSTGDVNRPCVFPIHDYNWRFGGNLLPETITYLSKIDRDFSLSSLSAVVEAGERLLEVCG